MKNSLKDFYKYFERKIPILDPDSAWKIFFNWLMIFFLFMNISYSAIFLIYIQEISNQENIIYMNLFSSIPKYSFLFEIFINIFTAYYYKGILVKNKILIINHFFKNDFPLDFVSIIIPFIIEFFSKTDIGKIVFLLRIIKLKMLFQKTEYHLHLNDKFSGLYDVFKLFLIIIFIDHLLSCAWVYLAQMEVYYGYESTWFMV